MAIGFSPKRTKDFALGGKNEFLNNPRGVALRDDGMILLRLPDNKMLVMDREDARDTAMGLLDCCDHWDDLHRETAETATIDQLPPLDDELKAMLGHEEAIAHQTRDEGEAIE